MKLNLILSIIFLLLWGSIGAKAQNAQPTISVQSFHKVIKTPDEPGMESSILYFEWKTTNAEYVLILGKDSEQHPTEGKIEASGSYIFVAVGRGGTATQAVAANLSMKPGTGEKGIIYKFDKEFNPEAFFQNAYKHQFNSNKSLAELTNTSVHILQEMNYTADNTKEIRSGPLVYTINFNPNRHLQQKQSPCGVRRQIAFIIHIKNNWLYILPIVRKNFPCDSDKWADDSDGFQLGIPPSRELANLILNAR